MQPDYSVVIAQAAREYVAERARYCDDQGIEARAAIAITLEKIRFMVYAEVHELDPLTWGGSDWSP